MAKRKTRRTARRSSSRRSKGKLMSYVMDAAMVGGGIIVGNMVAAKLPIADGKIRGAALALGGVLLAMNMPAMAMLGLGVSAGGVMTAASTMFPQLAAPMQGIGALSEGEVRALERAIAEGTNGPDDDGTYGPDDDVLNGEVLNGDDVLNGDGDDNY